MGQCQLILTLMDNLKDHSERCRFRVARIENANRNDSERCIGQAECAAAEIIHSCRTPRDQLRKEIERFPMGAKRS